MSTFSRLFLGSPSLHGHVASTPVPVVTNTTLNPLTTPITATAPIALTPLIPATNIPTSWAITATSPSNPTWFTIAPSGAAGSGQVSLTAAGKTGMNAAGTGTESLTVTASNAGGTSAPGTATIGFQPVSSDAYASVDGSPNASTGTIQFPNIISSNPNYVSSGSPRRITGTAGPPNYAPAAGGSQPPWRVAGIDYAVGINGGVALRTPTAGNLPAGVTVSGGSVNVGQSGAGFSGSPVLDSFDFTNMGVNVWGGSPTFTNCLIKQNAILRFQPPSNGAAPLGNVVIKYCQFDMTGYAGGGTVPDDTPLLVQNGANLFTIQYNWFNNAWAEGWQLTNADGSVFDLRFNLTSNAGQGAPIDQSHGDWIQLFGGFLVSGFTCNFNTWVQNIDSYRTQGVSLNASVPDFANGGTLGNNTMFILSNTDPGIFILQHQFGAQFNVINNFLDVTWLVTSGTGATRWLVNDAAFPGPHTPGGPIVVNGNITMAAIPGVPAGGSLDNV